MVEVISSRLPYLDYAAAAGHYIVAVGYDDEKGVIYIRDPNSYYVEELTYGEMEQAWDKPGLTLFTINRNDGAFVPPEKIEHFSAEARPFGADKEDHSLPFATAFIPTIYTVLHTSENGIENTTLQEDWLYLVRLHGVHFGHMSLERAPWIFQKNAFYGAGINAGFDFGSMRFLFGNGEAISPGVYRFLRNKTLDPRSFSTTKRIPALTQPTPVVEASVYMSLLGTVYPLPGLQTTRDDLPTFLDLRGGRVAFRHGIDQMWGYVGGGLSLNSVYVKRGAEGHRILVPGVDVTLGPFEGALQFHNFTFPDGIGFHMDAFSLALDFNLPRLSGGIFSVLDFLGVFRSYYQFRYERVRYVTRTSTLSYITINNQLELPMSLKIVDLVYGIDVQSDVLALEPWRVTLGARLVFNQLLPYFQAQAGYKFSWQGTGYSNHALHIGIHAGLWWAEA